MKYYTLYFGSRVAYWIYRTTNDNIIVDVHVRRLARPKFLEKWEIDIGRNVLSISKHIKEISEEEYFIEVL